MLNFEVQVWLILRHMKKGFLLLLLVVFIYSFAPSVFAQTTPQVSNVSASPSTVNAGTLLSLSWTLSNATGYSIRFSCQPGVTVFSESGTSLACDTRIPVTSAGSDSLGYSVVNVTGIQQRVGITMYPKDSAGADYDAGSMTTYVYVNTVVNPISDFTSSTLTPQSGVPFTLTWTSHHITGVNIKIDCSLDVAITPLSTTPFNCGSMLSSASLSASGSQLITATNKTLFASPITVTLLPVITSGSYDGINAKTISLSIGGALPPEDASASSFTSASTSVLSGATTTFSWVTKNAAGANIQIECMEGTSIFDASGTALPCGRPGFASPIKLASTTSVKIVNTGTTRKPLRVHLFLLRADGTYLPAVNREITVTVLGSGETVLPTSTPATGNTTMTTTTMPTPPVVAVPTTGQVQKSGTKLTLTLRKGMRHTQVTALQTFLSLDKTIYPEASITGLFGPATERAVQRFQKRYGIADEKNSAYGMVGPGTRAKINSLPKP